MNLTLRIIAIALLLATAARAQSADEILARHIAARGGQERLDKVQGMRLTGSLDLGPMKATLIQEQQRENQMRMDMIANMGGGEMHAIRAFDGKNGWAFLPQFGDAAPRPMKVDELKDATEQSEFMGPLIDAKKKGHQVEFIGVQTEADGHKSYKLQVKLKSGQMRTHWIDADTFLETMIEGEGEGQKFSQTLSDYRDVDGVKIPFKSVVEITSPNAPPQKFVYEVQKAEINPKFEEGHFNQPHDPPTTEPGK